MRLMWLAVGAWLAVPVASSDDPGVARAEADYWDMLDVWVKDGGLVSEVQSRVVDNCTKLALTTIGVSEWAALLTARRDELNFRVDVCVKAIVHRVNPQPEFSNPMFVDMICRNSAVALYRDLCVKANLQSDANAT